MEASYPLQVLIILASSDRTDFCMWKLDRRHPSLPYRHDLDPPQGEQICKS